jgi:hypothetical protein
MSLNNDANLVLHLKLDEIAGATTAVDSSGNSNDGTVAGGASTDFVGGKFGNGLQRTATGDNVACGDLALTDVDQSMAGWVRYDSGTGAAYLLSNHNGTVGGLSLYISGTDIQALRGNALQAAAGSSGVSDGNWHHIVVVYDAGVAISYYMDGVYVSQDVTITGAWNTTIATLVGERVGGTAPGLVTFDDIRLYSRVLLINEIRQLAQNPYNAINQGIKASISPSVSYSPATTSL